jgi:small GTP-binding protein
MNSVAEKTDFTFKILTIGESGVGKTCILLRYSDDKFMKNHLTTIGIDYKAKVINLSGKSIKLKIWDTAGQDRFRNITQQYYKGADGIVLVYDVTDRGSFEKVRDWMKQIQIYTQKDAIGMVLLGNKCDAEPRVVSNEEGDEMAKEYKIKYFETSALNKKNINESFDYLTQEIMGKKDLNPVQQGGGTGKIELDQPNRKPVDKKKGCC